MRQVVGASPELLVRVSDGKIETRPIAGTRPRGRDEAEDAALAAELLKDEKERAEHDMLVDLSRQDLGKVSKSGSVQVTEAMTVERYSHVMHLVSHVTGELREGVDPLEGFQACFPAGTVSGAPKNRALAKIAELEEESRGVYAGAIGYFSFNGSLDSCITIRTIHFRKDSALIQAGAGVVDGSVPEREYEESRNKARGLIRALALRKDYSNPWGDERRAEHSGAELSEADGERRFESFGVRDFNGGDDGWEIAAGASGCRIDGFADQGRDGGGAGRAGDFHASPSTSTFHGPSPGGRYLRHRGGRGQNL